MSPTVPQAAPSQEVCFKLAPTMATQWQQEWVFRLASGQATDCGEFRCWFGLALNGFPCLILVPLRSSYFQVSCAKPKIDCLRSKAWFSYSCLFLYLIRHKITHKQLPVLHPVCGWEVFFADFNIDDQHAISIWFPMMEAKKNDQQITHL